MAIYLLDSVIHPSNYCGLKWSVVGGKRELRTVQQTNLEQAAHNRCQQLPAPYKGALHDLGKQKQNSKNRQNDTVNWIDQRLFTSFTVQSIS